MDPKAAQWYLERINAYLEDPELARAKYYLSSDLFLEVLNSLGFEKPFKTFEEARLFFGAIAEDQLLARNLPNPETLKYWQEELEEAERQKGEIKKNVIEKIRASILRRQTAPLPVIPLAGPTKPQAPPEPPLFTPSVKEKLTKEEGVAFVPLYTLLQPRVALSFVKKLALAPVVKTLQALDILAGEELADEATPQWREMLHWGLTSQDLDTSAVAFEQAGVSPQHPQIKKLEEKKLRVKAYEQAHPRISNLLKHYHEFTKITGRRQIFSPEINAPLPRLSQAPAWLGKQGYSLKLKNFLNNRVARVFSFGRIQSLALVRSWASRKLISPILVRFGKTAIGQGIKKGAAWILTRLGLAAIPTGVTQVAAVALVVFDVVKLIFRKLKPLIKKLSLVLVGALLGLGALVVSFPLNILFFGASFLVLGTAFFGPSFLVGITTGISTIASQTTTTLTGILAGLTAPIAGTISALVVVGIISSLAAISFFIVITTSAAFLGGGRGEIVSYGESINPRPMEEGGQLAEQVILVLRQCGINYVNQTVWRKTEDCLENSNLPGKEAIIGQFKVSVNSFGNLQCVGFVRGVMAAIGKDPDNSRPRARDYLRDPIPSGYERYRRERGQENIMGSVEIGDLVIMEGTTHGHIAIVVTKEEKGGTIFISVAEALGNSGLLRVTRIQAYAFNGFLRAR